MMSTPCVYCGSSNDSSAFVCGACGRQLPPILERGGAELGNATLQPPERQPQEPSAYVTYPNEPTSYMPPPPPFEGGGYAPGGYGSNQPASQPSWPGSPNQWQPPSSGTATPGVWQPYGGVPQVSNPEIDKATSRARTAMILGIIGFFCTFIPVFGPLALVFGIRSRRVLERYGVQGGQGMALAGIVMGTVDIVLFLVYFMAMLASLGK